MPEVLSKYNRGVMATPCPSCGAAQNQRCRPISGRSIARPMEPHTARVRASQGAPLSPNTLVKDVAFLPRPLQELFKREGVDTLGVLASYTWEGLMDMRNFGIKSLAWSVLALQHAGLDLREHPTHQYHHPEQCEAGAATKNGPWCTPVYPCWRRNVQRMLEEMRATYPPPAGTA